MRQVSLDASTTASFGGETYTKEPRVRSIMIAGHVCIDLIPELRGSARIEPGALFDVGPMRLRAGGCVGNTARALSDLGHAVSVDLVVGDDELGKALQDDLRTALVGVRARTVPQSTSYSLVLEEAGSDRTFWHHVGSNAAVDGRDIDLDGVDLLHVGYPSLLPGLLPDDARPLAALLRRAQEGGVTTSIDLAVVDPQSPQADLDWPTILRVIASGSDILTPSLDDLRSILPTGVLSDGELAHYFADLLISWGAAVVAISAGREGLVVRTASAHRLSSGGRALADISASWCDATVTVPAVPVPEVRTTNGAGDASTAAILFGVANGWDLDETLSLAGAAAASVVSGARPTPAAIVAFMPGLASRLSAQPRAQVLPANQPEKRFYRGGERIASFRGSASFAPHTPEDWVASTVTVRGERVAGLSMLKDGRYLRDAIAQDPVGWLGATHVRRYGSDPKLLVKLLDAGQRLPVHAHPDASFAAAHVGAAHGKTEAWHILSEGSVYVGLRRDSSFAELADLVERQDTNSLLALLNEVRVDPGDRVLIPAGTLHAIGEGVLLVEVQEPEDLSILLEWRGFDIDGARFGHLGIGFDTALRAVSTLKMRPDQLDDVIARRTAHFRGLPAAADDFFRLEEVEVRGALDIDAGFAVIVGVDGMVELADAGTVIERGSTVVVPAALPSPSLRGRGVVLIARPPSS